MPALITMNPKRLYHKPAQADSVPVHLEVRVNDFTTLNFGVNFPRKDGKTRDRTVVVTAKKCQAAAMVRPGSPCTMEFPDTSMSEGVVREIRDDTAESVEFRIQMQE